MGISPHFLAFKFFCLLLKGLNSLHTVLVGPVGPTLDNERIDILLTSVHFRRVAY